MSRPFCQLEITLHLDAKTREKGDRVLARFAELFGYDFSIQSFERNTGDPSRFRVDLLKSLETENIEHAVFMGLMACSTFARSWTVAGPHEFDGGAWEFTGWATDRQIAIPGIRAAGFEIRNYE